VRIILSFNPRDVALAEAFRATLSVHAPDLEVFFSPLMYEDHRSLHLNKADAIVLFVGPRGLGESQIREFDLAQRRQRRSRAFGIVPVIAAGASIPEHLGSHLAWISAPVVTDGEVADQVIEVLGGLSGQPLTAGNTVPLGQRLRRRLA